MSDRIEVLDPATGDVIDSIPAGTPEDAVRTARAALPGWSRTDAVWWARTTT